MVSVSLSGCFGESEAPRVEQQPKVWDERPMLTWYHFPDTVDAWGDDTDFSGRSVPYPAKAALQHRHFGV